MTDQQLFTLFDLPVAPMPVAASKRIKSRVLAEARRLRGCSESVKLRRMRRRLRLRVGAAVLALTMLTLAANGASAEHASTVYLSLVKTPPVISTSPPPYGDPLRVWLPIVEVTR